MISQIRGIVAEKSEKNLIIETGGIGFGVTVTRETAAIANRDEEIKLFTYLHVREDVLALFGFNKKIERDFFIKLLSVSGIGPKLAMEIMEVPIDRIKSAIDEGNVNQLSEVKGLGKKTAQKMVLDLKGKISDEEFSELSSEGSFYAEEVVFTLLNLGFNRKEIFIRLKDLPQEVKTTEEIVRWFLKKG